MAISEHLAERLPLLRRYARALCGSQRSGDSYVRALLEGAIDDRALRDEIGQGRVHLYRAFTRLWSTSHVEGGDSNLMGGREGATHARLAVIPPEHRQALLLTTLEDFTPEEAGDVLGLEAEEVEALVARAVSEIDEETATTVLVIEDEPLIAMQLESLVTELGHEVVATATTRSQAVVRLVDQGFDRVEVRFRRVVVAEAIGLRLKVRERSGIGLGLGRIDAAWGERHGHVVAGSLGRLFDRDRSAQHDQVRQRDLLAAGGVLVELGADRIQLGHDLGQFGRIVDCPAALRVKPQARAIGPAAHVGAAIGRG